MKLVAWSFDTNPPQQRASSLEPLPTVDAGSFSVVVIAGKHVRSVSLNQDNEIDHNLLRQSHDKFLSLIFSQGIERKTWK